MRWPRRRPPAQPVSRRIGVSLVEMGYDEATAREQGARCLICRINPVFDGNLCILCNGCVDVCPNDCLKLVPASELEGDETVAAVIERTQSQPARCYSIPRAASDVVFVPPVARQKLSKWSHFGSRRR